MLRSGLCLLLEISISHMRLWYAAVAQGIGLSLGIWGKANGDNIDWI